MNKIFTKLTSGVLLCTMLTYTAPIFAYTKDETVYSKLDSTGKAYETIVSDRIMNNDNSSIINDMSDLLNLRNVGGDETFTQDGTKIVWNANGNNLYYQGESEKELPIECEIKYELDGEEISAEDIAGKSGKVKITITYVNKDSHIVKINGKSETLYTPFIVVCGTIVNNDTNTNVKISNGKAIDNGNKTTLIGLTLPGLQESLKISKSTVKIPDTVEITMDTTDFKMNNIVTYVTSKVIEDEEIDLFNNLDKIYSQVNTLQTSSKQIESGANTLKEGAVTYSEKSKEFNSAMNLVAQGTSTINSGYKKLDSGISNLSSGSKTLEAGVEDLNTGIATLSEKLSVLPASAKALYDGSALLDTSVNSETGLIAGVKTLEGTLTATSTTLGANYVSIATEIQQLTALKTTVAENATAVAQIDAMIDALKEQQTENATLISSLTSAEANDNLQALNDGLDALSAGTTNLKNNLNALNLSAQELSTKLPELTEGSKKVLAGTKELSSGVSNLTTGSSTLKSGIQSLNTNTIKLANANNQLTDGAESLAEGATTLANGITKFNTEGIDKICNYINGDLKDISVRLEKLQQLSNEYNNFTELSDGNEGTVKFIMIIDSIKKEDSNKQKAIINNNEENKDNNNE